MAKLVKHKKIKTKTQESENEEEPVKYVKLPIQSSLKIFFFTLRSDILLLFDVLLAQLKSKNVAKGIKMIEPFNSLNSFRYYFRKEPT